MATHKIDAQQSGCTNGMDWDVEYTITFSYEPGMPDQVAGPPDAWEQGYGPTVEFVSITPGAGDHGGFSDLAQKDLEEWAQDWLDEHLDECGAIAKADDQREADEAADMRREERGR